MLEFKLPALGSDMDEGTLLEWKVKPGDAVSKGQVVAIVDTSKAAVDVEIWVAGRIHELLVEPGEKIAVGTVLATLLAAGETPPPPSAARRRVSPAARKQAAALGIDLKDLVGSGPGGAITLADVAQAAAGRESERRPAPADRQAEMRKAIAAAMSRSKREIPHYYLAETIPLARAQAWLAHFNSSRPITGRVLMAALQLKAVAKALKKYPEMNGFFRDGVFAAAAAAHIGVAISLRQGGLIAPAIHDVGAKTLDQLMLDLGDLVKRARNGSLRSSEMTDPTITVTNLGDGGVETVYGVIYPPQVALLGFGRIDQRPWVDNGAVNVMPTVNTSLAADHRVSDGHRGALFLAELRECLQDPGSL